MFTDNVIVEKVLVFTTIICTISFVIVINERNSCNFSIYFIDEAAEKLEEAKNVRLHMNNLGLELGNIQ